MDDSSRYMNAAHAMQAGVQDTASAIEEATAWAMNDVGQYLVRRAKGGPARLAESKREIKLPSKVGQRKTYRRGGKTLTVKRTPARSYHMRIAGSSRARWADSANDARSDIEHFLDTGSLPRGSVSWS